MNSIIGPKSDIYQSLFDYNHDACYALDLKGKFILVNDAAAELVGYDKQELLQMSFYELMNLDEAEVATQYFKRVLEGVSERFNISIHKKDGKALDLFITAVPIWVEGKIEGVVGMVRDVTERNTLETMLNGQNHVLEMIAKGAKLTDVLAEIIRLVEFVSDDGICSIYLTEQDGTSLVNASSPSIPAAYTKQINHLPVGPESGAAAAAAYHKRPIIVSDIANDPLWKKHRDIAVKCGLRASWSTPVFNSQEEPIAVFSIYYNQPCEPTEADIQLIEKAVHLTSLAVHHYQAEEKINFMAFHDELTNLPKRRLFDERATEAIKQHTDKPQQAIAFMYLDLDRFKIINDTLGHNMGDLVLEHVARRLQSAIREEDTASRQGGDEFALLLNNVSKQEAASIAQRIINVLEEPLIVDGNEVFVTTSLGISLYPSDGDTVGDLLRKADIAMYKAKHKGRNNYQFYDAVLDKELYDRHEIEKELRKALEKGEFELHYQPIINLSTNTIVGAESLLRWKNSTLGHVVPDRFIPIAEETGMIVPIGEWILNTACRQLKAWEQEGLDLSVAVNISIRQFYKKNLAFVIADALNETGINPAHLTIEITESMTIDVETASKILRELKDLGVNISIDDFGTGYSSLSYLKTFPIDSLKIDQSFVQDIANSNCDQNIATAILLMAHNLGLNVIAEGVETTDQLDILRKYHCNCAQGYLFSKPLPAEEFKKLLENSY
ncbi:EAL domain-containing protein [Bacillus sp. FJAT-29814]|uniref:bifunctional diguanylate cyclase/phosphodiesterase n=1 Tax=Bacillus sp. FJAT-29814 TaxID=1729688 RepID=UPI00082FFFAA|nr:EAL domain-containing protein [Bacillus sp. FJAT-29814]